MLSDRARDALFAAILCCWAASVMAADQASTDLLELPWVQIGVGAMISLWGGLTRTVEVVAIAKKKGQRLALVPELIRDLFVSSCVGFIVYGLGALGKWDKWTVGVGLLVAGYLGTRFLSRYASSWVRSFEASRKGDL